MSPRNTTQGEDESVRTACISAHLLCEKITDMMEAIMRLDSIIEDQKTRIAELKARIKRMSE